MKKSFVFLLTLIVLLSLCACGRNPVSNITELQEKNAQLEQENRELKEQISELQKGVNSVNDNTNQTEEENSNPEPKTITLNSTFDVGETMSITLFSSEWCEEIKPSNTNGVYSYKSDVEGEKFFVVHGEIKNLASEVFNIEYAGKAEILINNKYKLTAGMETEEIDGSSFYGEIKPLQTLPLIIYSSVSDELFDIYETINLSLELLTDDEKVGFYYQDDFPHENYVISFNKQ